MLTFQLSMRERLIITWSHLETLLPQMGSECGVSWLEKGAWDRPPETVGADPHPYVPPPSLCTPPHILLQKSCS